MRTIALKRKDEQQKLRSERNDEAMKSIPSQLLIKKVSAAPLSETEVQRAAHDEASYLASPSAMGQATLQPPTPIFSNNRKKVSLFLPEIGNNPKLDAQAAEKKFLSRTSLGH